MCMPVPRRAVLGMLKTGLRPRDIMTKAALQNALTIVMALGGSTNAVLHFIAIGRALGVPVTLEDFQRISDQTPFIADLKPSGKYIMEDLHEASNIPFPVLQGGCCHLLSCHPVSATCAILHMICM